VSSPREAYCFYDLVAEEIEEQRPKLVNRTGDEAVTSTQADWRGRVEEGKGGWKMRKAVAIAESSYYKIVLGAR
jgi:hypothetical protein